MFFLLSWFRKRRAKVARYVLKASGRDRPTCYVTNLGYSEDMDMKKLTGLLAVVALGAGIALVGCGSDDDTTGPTAGAAGKSGGGGGTGKAGGGGGTGKAGGGGDAGADTAGSGGAAGEEAGGSGGDLAVGGDKGDSGAGGAAEAGTGGAA